MTGQTWLLVGIALLTLFGVFHLLTRRITARRNALFAAMAARHGGRVSIAATWREPRCAVVLDHGGRAVTVLEALATEGGRGFETDVTFEAERARDLRLELSRRRDDEEAFERRYQIDATPPEAAELLDAPLRALVAQLDRRLQGGAFRLLCRDERFVVRLRGRVPDVETLEKIFDLACRLCDAFSARLARTAKTPSPRGGGGSRAGETTSPSP